MTIIARSNKSLKKPIIQVLPNFYKKVCIKTMGCQMNVYDTQKMLDILKDKYALEQTDIENEADILIVNTCSVREKAEDKVYSQLGRWNKMKINNPHLIIGVTGCVASQEGENIIKRANYVDIVLGPQNIHQLGDAIISVWNSEQKRQTFVDISFNEIEKFDKLATPKATGFDAYITIMEGCSKFCTYCIVPFTRGAEISRRFDDVMSEVNELVSQGVIEIHLLGQNVNSYKSVNTEGNECYLSDLIREIAKIKDVKRIRFTTSNPLEFTDDLIATYADVPKLVDHLHLPIQSGSDRILSLMKRGHNQEYYMNLIKKIRSVRPNISISSDFIIGFPQESEDDFLATMKVVHEIGFDNSFSFIYSPRKGTPAANFEDKVTEDEKNRRLSLLQHRLTQHAESISRKMMGSEVEVLVTGISKKSFEQLSGRTQCNRIVNFDGNTSLIGQIVKVKVTDTVHSNILRGEYCS